MQIVDAAGGTSKDSLEDNLSNNYRKVLMYLRRNSGIVVRSTDISEFFVFSSNYTYQLLKKLKLLGLIDSWMDPPGSRNKIVELTELGVNISKSLAEKDLKIIELIFFNYVNTLDLEKQEALLERYRYSIEQGITDDFFSSESRNLFL